MWATALMLMLTVVVDRFFRPALEEMGSFLGLTEDGLGATILSLSNGIPHLIKQLASTDSGSNTLLSAALAMVRHQALRPARMLRHRWHARSPYTTQLSDMHVPGTQHLALRPRAVMMPDDVSHSLVNMPQHRLCACGQLHSLPWSD